MMRFNNFEQVISYFEQYSGYTQIKECDRVYRLDRMKSLMDALGNPQNTYSTIHIAGSKGKGSTASYLASSIKACGYKTGLYLSPHVTDYRERFTLCKEFFSDSFLLQNADEMAQKLDDFKYYINGELSKPSVFEMYTAFAFLLFKNAGCQWAVIETGLGGKLDATNILLPKAVVLTPIELEHTSILGNTTTQIAIEKSKIIKPNVPVFVSYQDDDVMNVYREEAKANNASFYPLSQNIKTLDSKTTIDCQKTYIEFTDGFSESLNLKMLGKVQSYNCALALLVLKTLGLYNKNCKNAIENNVLPARMEKINKERLFFIDGAHTKVSMNNLINSYRQIYPQKTGICIFSCIKEKNYQQMCQTILQNFDTVIVSKPGSYKQSDPKELYQYLNSIKSQNQKIYLFEDPQVAIKKAVEYTQKEQSILVCGSFYLAGEIKNALCH